MNKKENSINIFSLRRRSIIFATAAAGLTGSLAMATPSTYPHKPIKLIVGIGAGGAVDTIARLYAQYLSQALNTPVIVENRPGAFQTVAIRNLIGSEKDGYTLMMANGSSLSLGPATQPDLPYNPINDFTYIGQVGIWSSVILVKKDLPVNNIEELVAYSQQHPNLLNYGSAGVGTASHLKIEYLKSITGLNATHIPYKSDADVMREITAGDAHLGIGTTLSTIPAVKSGLVKAIAVTSKQPLPALPDVPSISQSRLGELDAMEPYSFIGIVGPSGIPKEIVEKINEAINKVSENPDVIKRMNELFYTEIKSGTPRDFKEFSNQELEKARATVKLLKM